MSRFSIRNVTFHVFICYAFATENISNVSNGPLFRFNKMLLVTSRAPSERFLEDLYFTQKLDHFEENEDEQKTWNQRYLKNDNFFKGDGSVFLKIGGESGISERHLLNGMWIEWAEMYSALCFCLEHRYYGKSQPTDDMSIDNLQYLNVAQALEDTANFITVMKSNLNLNDNINKWIVFGGSYAGALAAWMQRNYRHLVDGAVASSATFPKESFVPEYYESVCNTLKQFHPECCTNLKKAFDDLETMIHEDCTSVSEKFNIEPPLDCTDNSQVSILFKFLADIFAEKIRKNDEIHLLSYKMAFPSNKKPIDRLAFIMKEYLDGKYISFVDCDQQLKSIIWNPSSWSRQWAYQTCTELGGLETSSPSKKQPFPNYFHSKFMVHRYCTNIFGRDYKKGKIRKGMKKITKKYGGLNSEFSHTVFTVGNMDPWKSQNSMNYLYNGLFVIFIFNAGASHCEDMKTSNDSQDSAAMKQARHNIEKYVSEWIGK